VSGILDQSRVSDDGFPQEPLLTDSAVGGGGDDFSSIFLLGNRKIKFLG